MLMMRCILHVCGGDPSVTVSHKDKLAVFSTYVEVILFAAEFGTVCAGILHVCGGDPDLKFDSKQDAMYSPRMWR